MTMSGAETIYLSISRTTLSTLKRDLALAAVRYARIRADWALISKEQRKNKDKARTIAHDAFISTCNALSRNMNKIGEDTQWRVDLGDNRQEIGDFACYLHCFLGISAR